MPNLQPCQHQNANAARLETIFFQKSRKTLSGSKRILTLKRSTKILCSISQGHRKRGVANWLLMVVSLTLANPCFLKFHNQLLLHQCQIWAVRYPKGNNLNSKNSNLVNKRCNCQTRKLLPKLQIISMLPNNFSPKTRRKRHLSLRKNPRLTRAR